MPDIKVVSGQTDVHLVTDPDLGCMLHPNVSDPLRQLRRAAREAGFDIAVASSFRSFARQSTIWNDKMAGRRAVLDDSGSPVVIEQLDDWAKICAVMRWSALPGASRHHWGTDLDIFDRKGLHPGHPRVELTAAEWESSGPFHEFNQWLSKRIALNQAFGFYRPYALDRGGVGCEPWHISCWPVAQNFQRTLSATVLREVISRSDIALRDAVLAHMDEIYERFVCPL